MLTPPPHAGGSTTLCMSHFTDVETEAQEGKSQPAYSEAGSRVSCPAPTLRRADPTLGANTVPCLLCALSPSSCSLCFGSSLHTVAPALQGLPFQPFLAFREMRTGARPPCLQGALCGHCPCALCTCAPPHLCSCAPLHLRPSAPVTLRTPHPGPEPPNHIGLIAVT